MLIELLLFAILLPIAVLVVGIIIGLYFKGFDRRLAAYFQSRIGPPILQPFYDLRKLMMKQNIVPENAVKWIFNGAPLLALSTSVLLLMYTWVPYFSNLTGISTVFTGNMEDIILILYILVIPAACMIAGGFASGSPYAAVGTQREVVILMSTELPLAIIAITFGWKMSVAHPGYPPFSLDTMGWPIWTGMGPLGIIGGLLLLFTLLVVVPAELAKIPFDQSEAETEIAEGLLAEYSGKNLAFFHLAECVKSLALASLVVILFIPFGFKEIFGTHAIINDIDFTIIIDIIFFIIKIVLVYFVSVVVVRIGLARFKISQVGKIFLIFVSLLGFAGFILIWLDTLPIF